MTRREIKWMIQGWQMSEDVRKNDGFVWAYGID